MSPLTKYVAVIACGLVIGWLTGKIRYSSPSAPVVATPSVATLAPPAPPTPEWQRWLDETITLEAPATTAAFWQEWSAAGTQPNSRRQFLADSACLGMPWESFAAILPDPRFIGLNPESVNIFMASRPVQWAPFWWGRLWQAGPAAAISLTGKLPSPFLNDKLERLLCPALARTDPDIGLAWVQTLSDRLNPLSLFITEVAALDINKAIELWTRLPMDEPHPTRYSISNSVRFSAASTLVGAWGRQDWQAAMTWAVANLPPERTSEVISSMFSHCKDPAQRKNVLAAAAKMTDAALRSIAFSHMLTIGRPEADSLVAAALALPENALNTEGWGHLGQTSAGMVKRSSDPALEAAKLRTLAEKVPVEFREAYLKSAAIMAGWNNRPLAAQLFEFLPEGNAGSMAGEWAAKDPTAASSWLATLPPSPKRDAAVTGFCRELAPVDPPSAAQWALSVQDAGLKETALKDAVGAWKQKDPAAAQAWLLQKGVGMAGP